MWIRYIEDMHLLVHPVARDREIPVQPDRLRLAAEEIAEPRRMIRGGDIVELTAHMPVCDREQLSGCRDSGRELERVDMRGETRLLG